MRIRSAALVLCFLGLALPNGALRAQGSAGLDLIALFVSGDSVVIRAKMYNPPGVSYRLQAVFVALSYDPTLFNTTLDRGIKNLLFSAQHWDDDSNPLLENNGVAPDISLYGEECPNFCSLQINQNAVLNLCTFTFFPLNHAPGTASFCVVGNRPTGAMTGYYITTQTDNVPFDPVSCLDNMPFPVELNAFTAEQEDATVVLHWSTASETNNFGFAVERRFADAGNDAPWSAIDFVRGHDNTNTPVQYLFLDRTMPRDGLYEYRLGQRDFDGTTTFSHAVRVAFTRGVSDFSLAPTYPNPVSASQDPIVMLRYALPARGHATMTVSDALGRETMVLTDDTFDAGVHTAHMPVSGLPAGVYTATLVFTDTDTGVTRRASRTVTVLR
jgi:hypothetical protein